jgi:bacterioferritin
MGTIGKKLVGINAERIIELLNKAFCDEWLAYHQYWIGAKVVKGPMKEAVIAELLQHAADELRHAEMVVDRIIQLGGQPPIHPSEWLEKTNCGYDAPSDEFVKVILEQNIKGEQCAIETYNQLMQETKDKDFVTYNMVMAIITDEIEHEEDLQALSEDFDLMMTYKK